MTNEKQCHVFLADDAAKKELLTVYCKSPEYDQEQATILIAEDLATHHPENAYKLLYMGVIDFTDADPEINEHQSDFFEIRHPVWLTRSIYQPK
jgi:hypothetical protein